MHSKHVFPSVGGVMNDQWPLLKLLIYLQAKNKIANVKKDLECVLEKLELDRTNMESTLQEWKEDILAAAKRT